MQTDANKKPVERPAGERRRVPRRSFESPIGLLLRGEYSLQRAFQVGEGGMLISSSFALKIGQQVAVNFFINGEAVIVRGVVRNIIPAQGLMPERYGLEFISLDFRSKRVIRTYVASAANAE